MRQKIKQAFPQEVYQLLKEIGAQGDYTGSNVYLVGGVVRDVLLDYPTTDFDIVVEGDGIVFAKRLADLLGGSVKIYERFATATWYREDAKIDVVSARQESYHSPGALPKTEMSSLRADLYRRDFTINAMAIQLNLESFGKLHDFHDGRQDIVAKCIRVLHPLSFADDPIRLFRAVRFERRLGFQMDGETEKLAKASVGYIRNVSNERIANELRLLLLEGRFPESVQRLGEIGVWQALWGAESVNKLTLKRLKRLIKYYETICDAIENTKSDYLPFDPLWVCSVAVLCFETDDWLTNATKYLQRRQERQILHEMGQCIETSEQYIASDDQLIYDGIGMGELHRKLHRFHTSALLLLWVLREELPLERLIQYLQKRIALPHWIDGDVLKTLQVEPGPIYRQIQLEWQCAYMAGIVSGRQESLDWVKSFIFART